MSSTNCCKKLPVFPWVWLIGNLLQLFYIVCDLTRIHKSFNYDPGYNILEFYVLVQIRIATFKMAAAFTIGEFRGHLLYYNHHMPYYYHIFKTFELFIWIWEFNKLIHVKQNKNIFLFIPITGNKVHKSQVAYMQNLDTLICFKFLLPSPAQQINVVMILCHHTSARRCSASLIAW